MSSWAADCRNVLNPVHNAHDGDINSDRGTTKPAINGSSPTSLIDQVSSDDCGSTIDRLVKLERAFSLLPSRAQGHAAAHGFAPLFVARLVLTKACCLVGVPFILYVSKLVGSMINKNALI